MKKSPLAVALSALATAALCLTATPSIAAASPSTEASSSGSSLSSDGGSSSSSSGRDAVGARGDSTNSGKQLVTLGDSFTANGHVRGFRWLQRGIPQESLGSSSGSSDSGKGFVRPVELGLSGCGQDPDNWPRQLAGMTERSLGDYSCNGATSRSVVEHQLEQAFRDGNIGPATEEVVIAVGGLDPWRFKLDEVPFPYPQAVIDRYKARVANIAHQVRQLAPNARVTIPSYLSVSSPQGHVCFVNVIPNQPLGFVVPGAQRYEQALADIQRAAAHEASARFVDVRSATRDHHTCAPDAERYVSAIWVDTTAPTHTMAMHPTVKGSNAIARELAR
ncbi:GDSL-type esterase/lipase family protein [Corynebacterium propinquum]